MVKLRRFAFPTLILVIFVFMTGLVLWNTALVNDLQDQGKQPVSVLPAVPNVKGEKGDKGDSPSAQDIQQAVYDYCATTGICNGQSPSIEVVYAAVSNYCQQDRCKGATGADAQPTSPEQIRIAVQTFCANGNCRGENGASGLNGIDGKSPVMACVIRTTNNVATRYVAWKYETEANVLYRDLYKLPVWADAQNCVDLRPAA